MSQFKANLEPEVRAWVRSNVANKTCKIQLMEELYTKFRLHPALCVTETEFTDSLSDDWKRRITEAGPVPVKDAELLPRAPRKAITEFYMNGRSHLVPQSARRLGNTDLEMYVVDDFLSKTECARVIELMRGGMHKSTITSKTEKDSKYRTSSTSELNHLKDPWVDVLDTKIANFLGVKAEYSEGIQGQMYEVGEEFKEHCDYIAPDAAEYLEHTAAMGQRTWTFMVYLNNVKKGGCTHFTKVNQKFTPKRGQAVIWNNLKPDGSVNPASFHWGTQIEKGEKWIITKWFRERATPRDTWEHTEKTRAQMEVINTRLISTLQADAKEQATQEAAASKSRALQTAAAAAAAATVDTHVDPNFTLRKALYMCQMMAELAKMDSRSPQVEETNTLPTADVLRDVYFAHNRLLVVRGGAQQSDWPISEWTFAMLREKIGDRMVEVQSGRSMNPNFELAKGKHKKEMPFSEFLDKCETGPANDIYLTANNSESPLNRIATNIVLGTLPDYPHAYLKAGWLTRSSFLWVGNQGGFTPMHHDDANIVHTQVAGKKEWRVCPAYYFYKLANFCTVFTRISDPWNIDYDLFPEARDIPWIDFTLEAGDTVMLPQGWFHAVRCHGNNISISATDVGSGILQMRPSP